MPMVPGFARNSLAKNRSCPASRKNRSYSDGGSSRATWALELADTRIEIQVCAWHLPAPGLQLKPFYNGVEIGECGHLQLLATTRSPS